MGLVQFIIGFLVFSSAILINYLITSAIIRRGRKGGGKKKAIFLLYPLKMVLYLILFVVIHRSIGISFPFLLGVIASLSGFVLFSFLFLLPKAKKT